MSFKTLPPALLLTVLTACLPTPGPSIPAIPAPSFTRSAALAPTPTIAPATPSPTPAEAVDKFALWQQPSYFRGMNVNPTRNFIGDTDESGEVIIREPLLTQADLQALADLGANLVLASYPGPYRFNPPYQLDQGYLSYLDNVVDWAEEVRLYVVIAPRTGPGRSEQSFAASFDEVPDYAPWESFWSDPTAQEKWEEMWQFLAARYAGRPHVVGYELMVEPHPEELGIEPGQWYAFAEELIRAIRQVDRETPIIVPVTVWSSAYGFETAVRLSDDRLVYDVHQYEPFQFTHQFDPQSLTVNYPGEIEGEYWDRDQLLELLQPVRDFQAAHGVPIFLGEFGLVRWVPDGEGWLEDMVSIAEDYGWSYAAWVWRGDDEFNLERGSDPNNRTELAPGDNPLMRALWRRWAAANPSGFFPIGLYCVDDPADFPEIAEAGFNLVQSYRFEGVDTATDEQASAYLKAAQQAGLRVIMGIPQEAVWDNNLAVIEQRVRALKDHPALWGWTLFDEPESTEYGRGEPVPPQNFLAAYQAIKGLDPIHPVLFPIAVTLDESYPYTDGGDILILQHSVMPPGIFPWPWDSLASIRDALYPDIEFLAKRGQAALVAVQAYNLANDVYVWPAEISRSHGRYPTREEMRFSTYVSLMYGSVGVIFSCYRFDYGEGLGGDDISRRANPRQWQEVSSVASELQAMSAVLSKPMKELQEAGVTLEGDAGLEAMVKEHQGKTFLFTANPSPQAVEFRIQLAPDRFPHPSLEFLPTRQLIPSIDSAFTDRWLPYEVRIYEIVSGEGRIP